MSKNVKNDKQSQVLDDTSLFGQAPKGWKKPNVETGDPKKTAKRIKNQQNAQAKKKKN